MGNISQSRSQSSRMKAQIALLVIVGFISSFTSAKQIHQNRNDLPDVEKFIDSLDERGMEAMERIIGGEEIEDGEWPWLVKLEGEIPTSTWWGIVLSSTDVHCGGSLIGNQWVLTAAHCFVNEDYGDYSEDPDNWEAHLGDSDLETGIISSFWNWVTGDDNLVTIDAKKIIIHPNFDSNNLWYSDIALVKLKETVPSNNDHIGVVTLPSQGANDFPVDGANCVMKGWGCTEVNAATSEIAMAVNLPKVSDAECKSLWGLSETTTRLCAGHRLEDMGICSGDSGGPLVSQDSDGVWIQVGIASFASASAPGDWPGVFTRVSNYADWITSTINSN